MKTKVEVKKIADGLYAQAKENIDAVANVQKDAVAGFKANSDDDVLQFGAKIADAIQTVMKSPVVDGVHLPKFLSRVTVEGGSLTSVSVSVSSKLNAPYKYKKKESVAIDADFVTNVGQVYLDALFDMLYIEIALENLAALNEKVDAMLTEAGAGYKIVFTVDHKTDADVLSITDTEVVLNADIEKSMEVSEFGIMRPEDDEYSTLIVEEATAKFVSAVKALQTPAQFIKGNIEVVKKLTGLPTRKRASKLIRKSYHRKAMHLGGVKSGVGYYDETVQINGEEVNVFALVEKAEDGELTVVLSPFDVKTQFNVEFDVLAAVKEQLA